MTLRAWLRAHREARNRQAFAELVLAGPMFPRADWRERVDEYYYDGVPYEIAPWHPLWPGPADDGATLEAVRRLLSSDD